MRQSAFARYPDDRKSQSIRRDSQLMRLVVRWCVCNVVCGGSRVAVVVRGDRFPDTPFEASGNAQRRAVRRIVRG